MRRPTGRWHKRIDQTNDGSLRTVTKGLKHFSLRTSASIATITLRNVLKCVMLYLVAYAVIYSEKDWRTLLRCKQHRGRPQIQRMLLVGSVISRFDSAPLHFQSATFLSCNWKSQQKEILKSPTGWLKTEMADGLFW